MNLRPFSPSRFLGYINDDGGIPYTPGLSSFSEATLLMILAFIAAGEAPLAQPLIKWVLKNKNANGSIGLNADFPMDGLWNTSLLAIAMHHLGRTDETNAAVAFLLQWRSYVQKRSPQNDLDTELVGWSWVPHTFGWVEPTSWALMALNLAGAGEHPRAVEARRFIEDRSIPDGGWNYGNKLVFNHMLMPFWETTALALLALGKSNAPLANRTLEFMERSISDIRSLFSSAFVSICLDTFGRPNHGLRDRISKMLSLAEGHDLNLAHCAMGVIALNDRRVLTS